MKKTFLLLSILPLFLIAQNEKRIIIFKKFTNLYECILKIDNLGIETIFDTLHLNALENGVYLAYYGYTHEDTCNFKADYDVLNAIYIGDNQWFFNSFLMFDSVLDGLTQTDTFCNRRTDWLRDGVWFRITKTGEGIQIQATKTIFNGFVNGKYKTWHANGIPWQISTYKEGYLVDTTYIYNDRGVLIGKKIYFDSCNLLKEEFSYDLNGKNLLGYYNYYFGKRISFYENGLIKRICSMHNGKPHGIEYLYDEEGCIIDTIYWYYGLRKE